MKLDVPLPDAVIDELRKIRDDMHAVNTFAGLCTGCGGYIVDDEQELARLDFSEERLTSLLLASDDAMLRKAKP